MKFLCVIPARSGSKRLKNKNLKKISGKPLTYWTLLFAKKIKKFNRILITSDSNKILNIANQFKGIDKVLRPTKLAKDSTPMLEVINHSINFYKKNNISFDAVAILQPTSPLRKVDTINKACKIFEKNKPDSLASVIKLDTKSDSNHIIKLNKKKYINNFKYNIVSKSNNDYKLDGGVIFITKIKKRLKYIIGGKTLFVEVIYPESVDIDTNYDFQLAKFFMEKQN